MDLSSLPFPNNHTRRAGDTQVLLPNFVFFSGITKGRPGWGNRLEVVLIDNVWGIRYNKNDFFLGAAGYPARDRLTDLKKERLPVKKPFVTLEQLQAITEQYPTPFHLYDEKGIRENARRLYQAFSWNPGYREFFAVKATPNPQILKILREEGCGVDCSSLTELMMSDRCGFRGEEIMFSSNDTPAEEFALASQLGATINLDDITHIDFLKDTIGSIPKRISCRYNPGGTFTLGESEEGFQVMDNPGDAKYGMTREQLTQAFSRLKELGAEEFGIHAFLASNTLSNDYYPALLPVAFPASVISMLLLMALLLTGVVKERRIQTVSRFLVTNMGLFFIPSLVGTMEYVEVLRAQALPFLAVTFLTTPVVYLAAAWTVQLLMRRSRKEAGRHV